MSTALTVLTARARLQATALGLAAQQAKKEGHENATPEAGPWLFTLDFPSYFPVSAWSCEARWLHGGDP